MKNCLVCQSDSDRVELLRIPVSVEGAPFGDLLICRNCFELLGSEEVKQLVSVAISEHSYEASQFIPVGEGQADAVGPVIPRSTTFVVSEAMLNNSAEFARALGENLAPLLLARYEKNQYRVNFLTVCAPDEEGITRFRVVAEDP
jgi:hypothetical protein